MESRTSEEIWKEAESAQLEQVRAQAVTKHDQTLEKLLVKAKSDSNTLGFLVFGSVASGTHNEKSDIDVITIFQRQKPPSGINKMTVDGIIVDSLFFTYDVLTQSVSRVPYLLHTLGNAKLLLDREGTIESLLEKINYYFADNPEIESEWKEYYKQLKEMKMQSECVGASGKTIVDVWNELEKRHSGGKIKRPFFNSFYLTNTRIFSLVKRYLIHEGTNGGD